MTAVGDGAGRIHEASTVCTASWTVSCVLSRPTSSTVSSIPGIDCVGLLRTLTDDGTDPVRSS